RAIAEAIDLIVANDGVAAFADNGAIRLADDGAAVLVVFAALAAQRIDAHQRLPLCRLRRNSCAASSGGDGPRLLCRWRRQTGGRKRHRLHIRHNARRCLSWRLALHLRRRNRTGSWSLWLPRRRGGRSLTGSRSG